MPASPVSRPAALVSRFVLVPLCAALVLGLSGCGDTTKLPAGADMGVTPTLSQPVRSLIPTVNIAPAQGWPAGVMPDRKSVV